MHDPARVGGIERIGDLNGNLDDPGDLGSSLVHERAER